MKKKQQFASFLNSYHHLHPQNNNWLKHVQLLTHIYSTKHALIIKMKSGIRIYID